MRLTIVTSKNRPLPKPAWDDPYAQVYLDAAGSRPRVAPPWAEADISSLTVAATFAGTGAPASCLEIGRVAVNDADRVHVAAQTCALRPDVSSALALVGENWAVLAVRWRSWADARSAGPSLAGSEPVTWIRRVPASDHTTLNRAEWNIVAADYAQRHAVDLEADRRWSGGPFVTSFSLRELLGDVAGRVVIELGCGGGELASDLSDEGARAVGIDQSDGQLARAAPLVPVVLCDAEATAIRSGSVDLVFCAFGAIGGFTVIERTLAEVARILRPAGRAVWTWTGPVFNLLGDDFGSTELSRGYFDRTPFLDGEFEHHITYSDWVNAIVGAGLVLDALHEPEPDLNRWVESSWAWWSAERTAALPAMVAWEAHRPR